MQHSSVWPGPGPGPGATGPGWPLVSPTGSSDLVRASPAWCGAALGAVETDGGVRSCAAHEAGSHAIDRPSVSPLTLDTGARPSCPSHGPAARGRPAEHGRAPSSPPHEAGAQKRTPEVWGRGRAPGARGRHRQRPHCAQGPRLAREQLLFGASCADRAARPHPSTDRFAGLGFPKSFVRDPAACRASCGVNTAPPPPPRSLRFAIWASATARVRRAVEQGRPRGHAQCGRQCGCSPRRPLERPPWPECPSALS